MYYCINIFIIIYSEVVKRKRIRCVSFLVFCLSFAHIGTQSVGIKYNFYPTITAVGIGLDWILFFLIIIPYVLTVNVVRTHRRNSAHAQMLKEVDDTVTSIAFRIMIAITTMYSPYLVMSALRTLVAPGSKFKSSQTFKFVWFLSHGLIYSNSFVNALIFICVNSRCRRRVLGLLLCGRYYSANDSVRNSEVRSLDPVGFAAGVVRIQSASVIHANIEEKNFKEETKSRSYSANC